MAASQPGKGLARAGLLWSMLDPIHAGLSNGRVGESPVVSLGGANSKSEHLRAPCPWVYPSLVRGDRQVAPKSLSRQVRQTRCDTVRQMPNHRGEGTPVPPPALSTISQGTPKTAHDQNHAGIHRERHHHLCDACDLQGRGCPARAKPNPNRTHPFIRPEAARAATL